MLIVPTPVATGTLLKVGAVAIATALVVARAHACDEVRGAMELLSPTPNLFEQYDFTDRQRLLQADKMWPVDIELAERRGLARPSCGSELASLKYGFAALYPDSPMSRDVKGWFSSWIHHVQFQYFPDLVTGATRERLTKALEQIDAERLPVTPIPQRIDMLRYDFSTSDRWPRPVRDAKHAVCKLIELAIAKAYPPAMFELAKVSFRDDLIRLTPRFNYYLLTVAHAALPTTPDLTRFLNHARAHLGPEDRAEIEERARRRDWPVADRLVVD